MGFVITIIAIPFLIRVFCWGYGVFTAIRLAFSSIDKQEELFEREILFFQKSPREYPEECLSSLKQCCEFWIDYWSEDLNRLPDEDEDSFQELLAYQKKRQTFWKQALERICSEIWQRGFRK
ncbi:MAG: hypothetical protein ACI4OW_06425 [Alphaproteobacteria bacterium]